LHDDERPAGWRDVFFAACDSARAGMSVPRHIDMEIDSLSMTGDFLNLAA